jgi:hypothetical protein
MDISKTISEVLVPPQMIQHRQFQNIGKTQSTVQQSSIIISQRTPEKIAIQNAQRTPQQRAIENSKVTPEKISIKNARRTSQQRELEYTRAQDSQRQAQQTSNFDLSDAMIYGQKLQQLTQFVLCGICQTEDSQSNMEVLSHYDEEINQSGLSDMFKARLHEDNDQLYKESLLFYFENTGVLKGTNMLCKHCIKQLQKSKRRKQEASNTNAGETEGSSYLFTFLHFFIFYIYLSDSKFVYL